MFRDMDLGNAQADKETVQRLRGLRWATLKAIIAVTKLSTTRDISHINYIIPYGNQQMVEEAV